GLKSTIWNVRAAGTDGKLGFDEPPQPARTITAAAARIQRLIGVLSGTGSWDAARGNRRARARAGRGASTRAVSDRRHGACRRRTRTRRRETRRGASRRAVAPTP